MSNEVLTKVGNKAEWAAGGGGSVPKPLTYDYMPEGYPSKTVQTTVLMEKTDVEMTVQSNDIGVTTSIPYASLVAGNEYIVEIDGTEIPVTAIAIDRSIQIGNLILLMMSQGDMSYDNAKAMLEEQGIAYTEEPFSMSFNVNTKDSQLVIRGVDTTHTIGISTRTETIVPIDSKYIPDMDSIVLNSSTTDSTKKFKITVDDSGTISATEITN